MILDNETNERIEIFKRDKIRTLKNEIRNGLANLVRMELSYGRYLDNNYLVRSAIDFINSRLSTWVREELIESRYLIRNVSFMTLTELHFDIDIVPIVRPVDIVHIRLQSEEERNLINNSPPNIPYKYLAENPVLPQGYGDLMRVEDANLDWVIRHVYLNIIKEVQLLVEGPEAFNTTGSCFRQIRDMNLSRIVNAYGSHIPLYSEIFGTIYVEVPHPEQRPSNVRAIFYRGEESSENYLVFRRKVRSTSPPITMALPPLPWGYKIRNEVRDIVARNQLEGRKFKDFGVAPDYNEDYRRIRWPADQYTRNRASIRYDLNCKREGRWTNRSTGQRLNVDLCICLTNNIPFKTKCLRYDHRTSILHINETGWIMWDVVRNRTESFNLGNRYDKLVAMFFRRLGIDVTKRGRVIYWNRSSTRGENEEVLQLNKTYSVVKGSHLVNPLFHSSQVISSRFTYDSGITYNESREVHINRWLKLEGIKEPEEVVGTMETVETVETQG